MHIKKALEKLTSPKVLSVANTERSDDIDMDLVLKYHRKLTELESKKRLAEFFKPSLQTKMAKEKFQNEIIKYVKEMWESQAEYRQSKLQAKFDEGREKRLKDF